MPDLSQVLKAEIQRLARKELKQQLEPLRKQITQQRKDIAGLKKARQVAAKQRVETKPRPAKRETASGDVQDTRLRFRAKGFKSNRERLGLSGQQMAVLIGVSTATVYNWEQGKASPRRSQLPTIASLRGMGKREVQAQLETLGDTKTKAGRTG